MAFLTRQINIYHLEQADSIVFQMYNPDNQSRLANV